MTSWLPFVGLEQQHLRLTACEWNECPIGRDVSSRDLTDGTPKHPFVDSQHIRKPYAHTFTRGGLWTAEPVSRG
jgi:hypothetical protein